MGYSLGVDLGTTFTAAAIVRDGRAEMAMLGSRAAAVPTIVYLGEDGETLVGDAARRRLQSNPERVAREFKRRLGDATPVYMGNTPRSAESLLATVLRWVVDRISEQEGGPPDRTVVTYPANWGPYRRELLEQAIRQSGLVGTATITEPEAAAVSYASTERVEPGELVVVYDLGGGTFDAALLRKTTIGFEIAGAPEGIEHLGGIDIDDAVFAHVRHALGGAAESLRADDPATLRSLHRLRDECTEAKEALSYDSRAVVPVVLPGLQTEIAITRSELETMIRPLLSDTIAALRRAFSSADVDPADTRAVVLVGGSSRIPLVAELIAGELGRPVAVDAHPKHAIALGAALTAATAGAPTETLDTVDAPAPVAAPTMAEPETAPPEPGAAPSEPTTAQSRRRALAAAAVVALVIGGVVAAVVVRGNGEPEEIATEAPTTVAAEPTTTVPDTTTTPAPASTLPTPTDVITQLIDGGFADRPIVDLPGGRIYGATYQPVAFDLGNLAPYEFESVETNTGTGAVLANNLLYAADDDGAVYAFDPVSFGVAWAQFELGPVYGTPAVTETHLFVGTDDGALLGLDPFSGAITWGPYDVGSPVNIGPAVEGGVVIAPGAEEIHAVDIATQQRLWRVAIDASATPVVVDDIVYLPAYSNEVYALDLATGRELGRVDLGATSNGRLAIADGSAFVGLDNGDLAAYSIDGDHLWDFATGGAIEFGPVVADGVVYVGSGDTFVYAVTTAGELLWSFQTDGEIQGSPALAGDRLIVSSLTTLYSIALPAAG